MNDSVELLKQLVQYDTTSYKSNLDLIYYIKSLLEKNGIAVTLNFDKAKNKANLLASIGPLQEAGILLSGHSDVVPVEGQQWDTPPFQATIKDHRVFGRGTADMKGFLSCAIVAMIKAKTKNLTKPLHLCISYDEEIGCIGVRGILNHLTQTLTPPMFCVIGEPTMMQIALAHKGKAVFKARCCGQEGHSALAPRFVNAIHVAGSLVQAIQNVQKDLQYGGSQDEGYDIPYSTVHVGKISGGSALNIVPNECIVDYEIRYLAQDNYQEIQNNVMTLIAKEWQNYVDIEEVNQYPGLATSKTIQAVKWLQTLLPKNTTLGNISFGTEGGLFQSALNSPVMVCGPGDIAVAHKPNEYVDIEQLVQCDIFLEKLIASIAT